MSGRGGEAQRKENEEGEKDEYEDTRDRAVDTVNGPGKVQGSEE